MPFAKTYPQAALDMFTHTGEEGKKFNLQTVIMIPAINTIKKPKLPSCKLDILFGLMRVAKSLPAKPIIPKIAKMENRLKPSVPGWIISKTPMKPKIIAVHLRQPTFSPRKKHSPHYHNKRC